MEISLDQHQHALSQSSTLDGVTLIVQDQKRAAANLLDLPLEERDRRSIARELLPQLNRETAMSCDYINAYTPFFPALRDIENVTSEDCTRLRTYPIREYEERFLAQGFPESVIMKNAPLLAIERVNQIARQMNWIRQDQSVPHDAWMYAIMKASNEVAGLVYGQDTDRPFPGIPNILT